MKHPRLRIGRAARALPLLVALAATLGLPARPAAAQLQIGIGQQSSNLFASPYWYALRLPNVRYVAPWDVLSDPLQRVRLDQFMRAAVRAHADVMLGLQHSMRNARLARRLPTPAQYERAFRRLRRRYPTVRKWVPWNETNHPSALTARRPALVAAYYNAVTSLCRGCDVVAGDVLDTGNMAWWIHEFLLHTRTQPRIWGLHNYDDANRFRREGAIRLLRMVSGQIWFTETGGVVRYRIHVRGRQRTRNFGEAHAARSTRYVLDLSRLSPRITRIYLYNWTAPLRYTTWDSGLMNARMRPRRSYRVLRAWLVRARRIRLIRR